jgi:hypothetical protein
MTARDKEAGRFEEMANTAEWRGDWLARGGRS